MYYKPGDKVAVFEDPIMRRDFEGEATIVRHHRDDWYDVDFNYLNGKHVRRKVIRPPEQTATTKAAVAAFKLGGADGLAGKLAQKLQSMRQEAIERQTVAMDTFDPDECRTASEMVMDLTMAAKLAEDIQQIVRPSSAETPAGFKRFL